MSVIRQAAGGIKPIASWAFIGSIGGVAEWPFNPNLQQAFSFPAFGTAELLTGENSASPAQPGRQSEI
jgi:hypothetical protein